MKFDVIVGNPPFNDETSSGNALWSQFIAKADTLLIDDGLLSMIVPSRWVLPGHNLNKGKIRIWDEYIATRNTTVINVGECSKYFPTIGSDPDYFSYFTYSKKTYHGQTKVVHKSGNTNIDTRIVNWLPLRMISDVNISIAQKMTSAAFESFDLSWKYEHKGEKLANEGTYPVFVGNNSDGAPNIKFSSKPSILLNTPKILFKLGRFLSYDKRLLVDSYGEYGYNSAYVAKIEYGAKHSYLNSKLYRHLAEMLFNGSEITASGYRCFPKLEDRSWTDEELYAHFNLTQEEIDYIEQTVK